MTAAGYIEIDDFDHPNELVLITSIARKRTTKLLSRPGKWVLLPRAMGTETWRHSLVVAVDRSLLLRDSYRVLYQIFHWAGGRYGRT